MYPYIYSLQYLYEFLQPLSQQSDIFMFDINVVRRYLKPFMHNRGHKWYMEHFNICDRMLQSIHSWCHKWSNRKCFSTFPSPGIMRIPFACLLLFSATVLSQDASITPRYRKFIEQHVNGRMSVDRCDSVIGSRRISKTNSNECKETNTFIQATTNHIKAICEQAGEPYGDMTKSLQPFPIIVCTLKNQQGRLPHCQYRGQARTRRIAIKCEQGFPVHFERDIIHFENWKQLLFQLLGK